MLMRPRDDMCRRLSGGFTIVELTIVLLIIAIIGGIVLSTTGITNSARAQEVIGVVKDIRDAARVFKERYGYQPGDLPNAQTSIPTVPLACNYTTADLATAGNGVIDDPLEIACAIDMLRSADLIRAQPDPANAGRFVLRTSDGVVRLVHSALSAAGGGAPPTSNIIEFARVRCDVALAVDLKLDDGALGTGEIRGSVAACQRDVNNDPVPFFAMRLN